jgi:hypothetical protein
MLPGMERDKHISGKEDPQIHKFQNKVKKGWMEEKANNPMAESLYKLLVTIHMDLHVSIVYCVDKNVRVRVQSKGGIMEW